MYVRTISRTTLPRYAEAMNATTRTLASQEKTTRPIGEPTATHLCSKLVICRCLVDISS